MPLNWKENGRVSKLFETSHIREHLNGRVMRESERVQAIVKQLLRPFKPGEDRFAGMDVQACPSTAPPPGPGRRVLLHDLRAQIKIKICSCWLLASALAFAQRLPFFNPNSVPGPGRWVSLHDLRAQLKKACAHTPMAHMQRNGEWRGAATLQRRGALTLGRRCATQGVP